MYGMVIFSCGMIGLLVTHSKSALISGGVGGILLFLCYMLSEKKVAIADKMGNTLTYLLTMAFAWRFYIVYAKITATGSLEYLAPTVILGMMTATGFLASAMIIRHKKETN